MRQRILLLVFSLVLSCSSLAHAQFEVGSIVGAVTDPSGARIVGATVEARQKATDSSRKTITSSTGEYAFVGLQPGVYTITVTQNGFGTQTRTVNVAVSERVEANVALTVGGGETTVDVDASASSVAIETGSSELGNVRSQDQVQGLPPEQQELHPACLSRSRSQQPRQLRQLGLAGLHQRPRHQRRRHRRQSA